MAAYNISTGAEATAEQLAAADMNGDGQITLVDAMMIYNKSIGAA